MAADPSPAAVDDPPTRHGDVTIAVALGLVAAALYIGFGLRLAQGEFLDYYNLAFDFDPYRYVALLGLDDYERGGVKHPLVILLRPLAWPLLAVGLGAKVASTLVMVGFGAATVSVVFLFLRTMTVARAEAMALAALFAVSGNQFFTAIIAEAYGPAAFGIALIWLVTAVRLHDPARYRWLRYALAAYAYGITTTNLVQSLLAEALVWVRHRGLLGAVRPLLLFGGVLVAILLGLTLAVWSDGVLEALDDPAAALKAVYWQRTKGERSGAVEVLVRLVGYSVVSPAYSLVAIPGGIVMLDFRAPSFAPLAAIAAIAWHLFWIAGVVGALAHPRTRWLAAGLAGTLLFNILFHIDFQFRGSLYLYAPHTHFLVFALGAGLAPLLRPGTLARQLYIAVVLLLVVLVGGVTLDRVASLVTGYDQVVVECKAPCAE